MLDEHDSSEHVFDEWASTWAAFHQTYIKWFIHQMNESILIFLMNEPFHEKPPLVLV
jgi:hypothetical protein